MSALPYFLLFICSGLILIGISAYGWRQRRVRAISATSLTLFLYAIWPLTQAVDVTTSDLALKILLMKIRLIPIFFASVSWLLVAVYFTGRDRLITRTRLALLCVAPSLTAVLLITGPDTLIRFDYRVNISGPFPILEWQNGPMFFAQLVSSYALFVASVFFFIRAYRVAVFPFNRQVIVTTTAIILPFITEISFQLGFSPLPGFNLTPAILGISGLLLAWGIYGYRLLDITPIARNIIIDGLSDGVIVLDTQARIVDINPAARQNLNLPNGSIIGRPLKEIFAPLAELIDQPHTPIDPRAEISLGETGQRRDYEVQVSPLTDKRGNIFGQIVTLRDMTQRKLAEEKAREEKEKYLRLLESARRQARELALLGEVGTALAHEVDLDDLLRVVVKATAQTFGYTHVSIYLQHGDVLKLQHQTGYPQSITDLPLTRGVIARSIRTNAAIFLPDVRLEPEFIGSTEKTSSEICVPLFDQQQAVGALNVESERGFILTETDLDSIEAIGKQISIALGRARLYANLRQQAAELNTRNVELDTFAHTVAHDLKGPIGTIIGFGELLLNVEYGNLPQAEVQQSLRNMLSSGRKLDRIVEELMLLAGVRQQEIHPVPIDLGETVTEALRNLSSLIQKTGAQITRRDQAIWPQALGYAPWIEEAWVNYLSNAMKYGGQPPCVELGVDLIDNEHVRGWVRDNGNGLTPEERQRLFIPFTRLDQARARGHGLGLSIVKRIVEKLGGTVGVESKIGAGSTFYFILQADTSADSAEDRTQVSPVMAASH